MATAPIQSGSEVTVDQRVNSQAFGDGTVADIDGDVITVRFEDGKERKLKAEYLQPAETLVQLRDKFRACWRRGSEWRLEVGELLYKIKGRCAHGQWGEFLDEYEISRSTADDYIRYYKDKAGITESRQFEEPDPAPAPDPEADEREQDIEQEKSKRKGKPRTHHQSQVRPTIKGLRPDQTARYWEEYSESSERVNGIWYQALLTIIRSKEVYPPPFAEDERGEVTSETIAIEEKSCTAS